MSEQRFWQIIDAARGASDSTARSASPSALKKQLEALPDKEVAAFSIRYSAELLTLNRWSVWDAGYALANGMSDDDFHYFRSWLIGKGQAALNQALTDPDSLTQYVTSDDWSKDSFDNEELEYVAGDVLAERGGQAAADQFGDKTLVDTDSDTKGAQLPEESIDARFPQLAAWASAHESN